MQCLNLAWTMNTYPLVQGIRFTKRAVSLDVQEHIAYTFQPTSYKYLFVGSRPLNGHPYKKIISHWF